MIYIGTRDQREALNDELDILNVKINTGRSHGKRLSREELVKIRKKKAKIEKLLERNFGIY